MSVELRRARRGVTIVFWLNAVAWASVLPRFPEIKRELVIADLPWGVYLSLASIVGMLSGMLSARLLRRFRSAQVVSVTQTCAMASLLLFAVVDSPVLFVLALTTMSAFDSVCDIAMNHHGMRVQVGYGRSILNGFHAWWSVGAVSGGLIGAGLAQAGVPLMWQCVALTAVFVALTRYARTLLLAGDDPRPVGGDDGAAPRRIRPQAVARLLALGTLGAAAMLLEDSGASWGAVYLDARFQAAPIVAGLAFVALQGAQMVGRFTGDRIVDALGPRLTVLSGLGVAAVGTTLALVWPSPALTIVGFAAAGWGIATVIPQAMHAGANIPGLPHGTGLTTVTSFLRLGALVGPPLIGATIETVGLEWGLFVLPVAALVGLATAPALPHGRAARR